MPSVASPKKRSCAHGAGSVGSEDVLGVETCQTGVARVSRYITPAATHTGRSVGRVVVVMPALRRS